MPGCLPRAPVRVRLPSARVGRMGAGRAGGGGVRLEVWSGFVLGHPDRNAKGPLGH